MLTKRTCWYQNGLAFSCRQCGRCCAGPGEGYVWVNREEIAALAARLTIDVTEFKRLYTRRVGIRYSLIEKQPSKDCVFLDKDGPNGPVCRVYDQRPRQCRTWPFWKENLRTPDQWQQARQTCPGIDQGRWFSLAQIEAIQNNSIALEAAGRHLPDAAWDWIVQHHQSREIHRPLQELYEIIDARTAAARYECRSCGRCCDFASYGHRLYVTTLEMMYLYHGLTRIDHGLSGSPAPAAGQTGISRSNSRPPLPAAKKGRCPSQQDQICRARQFRPAGCRIFFCRTPNPQFQAELSEYAHKQLRRLHEQLRIVYWYADLGTWVESYHPDGPADAPLRCPTHVREHPGRRRERLANRFSDFGR
ncbi:MAG: YkgJ family cysteine cluster protein [Sedimentisphaerales bacterium]|nr:YkgJ family cysteine cluster protein [Sedimentisphaerales bacterium]